MQRVAAVLELLCGQNHHIPSEHCSSTHRGCRCAKRTAGAKSKTTGLLRWLRTKRTRCTSKGWCSCGAESRGRASCRPECGLLQKRETQSIYN